LLWTAQSISTIGSALTSLAASILVFRITGSALSVGLMLMATAAPSIFVGLIAGVFVDRFDRKRIMIAADLLRAVLVALIPFLIPFGIAWLYIIVMLSSAVTQFYEPAHESVVPELAPDEELAAANSMMAISSFGFTTVGFAAAGLIASRFSIEAAFYLDALSFVLSAACVALIRIAPIQADDTTTIGVVVQNLRAGGKFLMENANLRSLLILSIPVSIVFGLQNALLLPFALKALHATEFEYGLQEGLTSVGFVIGSLMMARLADRLHAGQWLAISFAAMALTGMLYAFQTSVPLAIIIMMVSGLTNAPSVIGRKLIIQRTTPREVRGRVVSAFSVSGNVMFLLGMAAAGLADLYDVRALFFGGSVVLVAAAALAFVLSGLRQPMAEWRRAVSMLRGAASAPGLGLGRAATLADFDLLALRLPTIAGLSAQERQRVAKEARVYEADAGAAIVRHGERSNAAYFILDGRAVAGREEEGTYRSLEVLQAGDFFGEIAAMTGGVRTANVVAEQPTTLLEVPAATLRRMMDDPQINRIFLSKMTERMVRMNMIDLPRFAGIDQEALRELRTPEPEPAG
jgi:MFS family permease